MKLIITLMILILNSFQAFASDPLPANEAFQMKVEKENDDIKLKWEIADGYYLYKDHTQAKSGKEKLLISTPQGIIKDDPTFGQTEVFYDKTQALVINPGTKEINVTYQGCQDEGICYRPVHKIIDPISLAVSDSDQIGFTDFSFNPTLEITDTIDENNRDNISSILESQDFFLIVFSFMMFGLLLAFTPCVFPMYPVLAKTLEMQGSKLNAKSGFIMSSIYVLSLSLAFSLIGIVAGYSGKNLQLILQSQYTIIFIASIFVIFALSMIGLFEIQLPQKFVNSIMSKSSNKSGVKSAAVMGFSSALIIGPCVTAPLAGALIFIAQTGNVLLGAVALFALGIGKGIPLIIFGTFGSSILPRAGMWMETVKYIFCFIFLGVAIYILSPILAIGTDMLLYAILCLLIGSYFLTISVVSVNLKTIKTTITSLLFLYGSILMLGYMTNNNDVFNPLANFSKNVIENNVDVQFKKLETFSDIQADINDSNKDTIVYFNADWCTTCHQIEKRIQSDYNIRKTLSNYNLVNVDLTNMTSDKEAILQEMHVVGPPTAIIFDKNNKEIKRYVGDIFVDKI